MFKDSKATYCNNKLMKTLAFLLRNKKSINHETN